MFILLALLASIATGCSTWEKTVTREKPKETSRTLKSGRIVLTEIDRSYKGNTKTVIIRPEMENTYEVNGVIVHTTCRVYVAYNPLYEIVEIPEGAFNILTLPLVLSANFCCGHYRGEFADNDPWKRNILPALYKLCPITNDRRSLAGRKKKAEDVIKTEEKTAEPWEEISDEPCAASFVSARLTPENKKPARIIRAEQGADGNITLTFSVDADLSIPFMNTYRFMLKLEIDNVPEGPLGDRGEIDVPFQTFFDNINSEGKL